MRERMRTYSAVRGAGSRAACSTIDHDLAAYLSVLLSTALAKIDLNGCSLDHIGLFAIFFASKSISKNFYAKILS